MRPIFLFQNSVIGTDKYIRSKKISKFRASSNNGQLTFVVQFYEIIFYKMIYKMIYILLLTRYLTERMKHI